MGMRVLVVEDDDDLRELLTMLLISAGHEVENTASGVNAINMAFAHPYDVVVSDIGLPDRDGWTVAKLIHRRAPSTRIYLVTGWSHLVRPDLLQGRPEVRAMLRKPYCLQLILDAVEGNEDKVKRAVENNEHA